MPRFGVEFQSFDEEYVRALADGDPVIERHFTNYFGELLGIKLRARRLPDHTIEDIRQETFLRVFVALRRKSSLEHPERLGAFVNGVCNNVFLEYIRSKGSQPSAKADVPAELADDARTAEAKLISDEHRRVVAEVLAELPARDEQVLRKVLLNEEDKAEVCRAMSITRENLRVLLHRAKVHFRQVLEQKYSRYVTSSARTHDDGALRRKGQEAS